jgi:hypothetical protein
VWQRRSYSASYSEPLLIVNANRDDPHRPEPLKQQRDSEYRCDGGEHILGADRDSLPA